MLRFIRSLILGLALGGMAGLYLGWVHFPQDDYRGRLAELALSHRDDYLVMVAAGYAWDGDLAGVFQRLSHLDQLDIPRYVQERAERIISTAARDIHDIRLLAQLAAGLRRVTPAMQPFLDLGGKQS